MPRILCVSLLSSLLLTGGCATLTKGGSQTVTVEREVAEVKERIDQRCARNDCERQLAAAEAGKAERLAEIDRRRAAATIPGGF
jgi:hypothetical protein